MAVNNFNYIVSWSKFTHLSARPHGVKEDAQIHPELSFSKFKIARKGNAVIIKDVTIDIYLVLADCWVVTSKKTDALKKHEQGHYDILTIYAREIYHIILGLSAETTDELQTKIDDEKERLEKKVTAIDDDYDVKTNHHLDTTVQQEWDRRIETIRANPKGSIDDLP